MNFASNIKSGVEQFRNDSNDVVNQSRTVTNERNGRDVGWKILQNGDGDVIRNYKWGITSANQIKITEVPMIELIEFQPKNSPMLEAVLHGWNMIKSGVSHVVSDKEGIDQSDIDELKQQTTRRSGDEYATMYNANPTGNVYRFPYFDQYNHIVRNMWNDTDIFGSKLMSDRNKTLLTTGLGILTNSYGGILKRKTWMGTESISFTTSFHLFNTLSGSLKEAKKIINMNFDLISTLIYNNLSDKLSPITSMPPVIYTLEIPGVRYSPAVFMSNVSIENIGQVNRRKDIIFDGKLIEANIPDAWYVTLEFTEMLPESRNIYETVLTGRKTVEVISNET